MVSHLIVSPLERVRPQWKNLVLRVPPGADVSISDGLSLRRIEFERAADVVRLAIEGRLSSPLPDGVRILVGVRSSDQVAELADGLRSHADLNVWVRPLADHFAVAQAAGNAALPVLFSDGDAEVLSGDLGLDLLSYYLFDPDLAVPLEPFHSLLRAELGENRTLWNIWFGRPEEHFFVGTDGHVSLCSSWISREERRYGSDSSGRHDWVASEGHRLLRDMLSGKSLPERCRNCPVSSRCQGAVWAVTGNDVCGQWPEIITRVNLAARAMTSHRGSRTRPDMSG